MFCFMHLASQHVQFQSVAKTACLNADRGLSIVSLMVGAVLLLYRLSLSLSAR